MKRRRPARPRPRPRQPTSTSQEVETLRARLQEAEETLRAIRSGEVDALVIQGRDGEQVFGLAGADQSYRVFVEEMNEGAITVSTAGDILYSNRRFAEMTRTPLERVIGAPLRRFLRDVDRDAASILIQNGGGRCELTLCGADGASMPVFASAGTLGIGGMRTVYLLMTDLTEQKDHEESRELLARAQAAREEAEWANRAKDQFLATLSHELRTPLNSIYGWVRMLRDDTISAEQRARALDIIDRSARLQTKLVEDLLDVSRIITGKMRLEVRPIQPRLVVDDVVESMRPAAEAKDIALHATYAAPIPDVPADIARLQQAVWNLVSNAIKFTPGGGRVWIDVRSAGGDVVIVVGDTGKGISPAALPHIFERFSQEDGSSSRAYGGLGIGLALARHLIELHGGVVTAESAGHGQGALFTIRLPIAAGAPPATPPEAATRPHAARQSPLTGVRVIVIGIEPEDGDAIAGILGRAGAAVRVCGSVGEAWDACVAWHASVVIADLAIPDEYGHALIRRLRALPLGRGGEIAAIALTAEGGDPDSTRVLAAGFTLQVARPFDPHALVAVVAQAVSRTS